MELEREREILETHLREAEEARDKLEAKNEKLETEKKQQRKEEQDLEDQVEKLETQLAKTVEKGATNAKKVVQLEIENEELQNEARRRGFIIGDLEVKFDT